MTTFPELHQGEDRTFLLEVTLSSGTLLGCSAWLTIKSRLSLSDDQAELQLRTQDGTIEIADATHLRLKFRNSATKFLSGGVYYIDIRIKTTDNEIIPVGNIENKFTVRAEVTRSS